MADRIEPPIGASLGRVIREEAKRAKRRPKVHATDCPALSAWDIPGACNCSGRAAFPVDAPEVPNG